MNSLSYLQKDELDDIPIELSKVQSVKVTNPRGSLILTAPTLANVYPDCISVQQVAKHSSSFYDFFINVLMCLGVFICWKGNLCPRFSKTYTELLIV